jgi:hypothetical protein
MVAAVRANPNNRRREEESLTTRTIHSLTQISLANEFHRVCSFNSPVLKAGNSFVLEVG